MPTQVELQKEITHRILDGLLFGTAPWRKPWRNDPNAGSPANVISRRRYSGINPILLDLTAMARGYTSRWWATYAQWTSLGAQVRKRPSDVKPGQWGTTVVFWKPIQKTKKDASGKEKIDTFPLLRSYTVFNLDQVDGEAVDHLRCSATSNASPLSADYEAAQKAINATGADIRFGGNRAMYLRPIGPTWPNHYGGDYIMMPGITQFLSPHEFYSTCMHELVHWSEVRLNWTGSYAMGELIAEIGAAFACAELNIPCSDDMTNHAAYVADWIKELQDDERAVLKAASQATKAVNYILSFSRTPDPIPADEAASA